MASRLELHNKFIEILGTVDEEIKRVYFQPPANVQMKYPCIKYSKADIDQLYANDGNYRNINRYEIIVIDYDPDSEIPINILNSFRMCSFDRTYPANNLNHFVLTLYF